MAKSNTARRASKSPKDADSNITAAISPFARGLHAISAIYDNPDHIAGTQLRTKVLSASAIAVFITQAWLTRALGKWVAADQRRNAVKPESTVSSTFENLAMSVLSLPISTTIFVLLLTLILGAPIPFTDGHTIPTLTLAFHLALMIALPTSHILGSDWSRWDTVFLPALHAPPSAAPPPPQSQKGADSKTSSRGSAWHAVLFYPATGALLGAVLASFGLALDWGRPWQIWPLPPLLGSTAGLVVGNWLGIRAYMLQVSA
ncbi:Glycosylphosphatidylinositol (GPI) anchor assembly protein [Tilletia horrida]|uniref:Glycosylphosphatidylinositol (GPI) anchor assembly protein n=1 Tax=Tilletia horrida TaxID=155126 RepID=A0AAN6GL63_9BASI|nr:Glycosylphosphatidylinositol (GPI) anchor assembly protein [Tilletia horrida]KAK0559557.1 Glycosylphosphatidylinositol (GPI) anchor assembly protein [Tilletia horrida]